MRECSGVNYTVTMATDEMLCAQLMKAAKTGNVKEVKKLLHKGALFTKDEVNHNYIMYIELAGLIDEANQLIYQLIQYY